MILSTIELNEVVYNTRVIAVDGVGMIVAGDTLNEVYSDIVDSEAESEELKTEAETVDSCIFCYIPDDMIETSPDSEIQTYIKDNIL